jgi:pyruvate dehydrogenase E2 component (dihydrolipoamide acetyltransferase)
MRAAIAEHLQKSLVESAQLTAMGEIDMTELVKLRREFLAREAAIGTRVTYTDVLVFVVARVCGKSPCSIRVSLPRRSRCGTIST